MFFVYVLYSENFDRTYTGMTIDVPKRFKQHNSKQNKSTKAYVPWVIILIEEFKTRVKAREREKYLKTGIRREFVKTLLNSQK